MSITSSINGQLGPICTLCLVLLLGVLLHRVVRIASRLLLAGLIFLPSATAVEDPLQKYAQKGLIGSALHFVIMVIVTCMQLVVVAINILWTLLLGLLPLVGLALLLVLVHAKWGDSMVVVVEVMNGQMGATLREILVAPLTMLDMVGSYALPVYNFLVYVIMRIPLQMLFWLLKGPGFNHLMDALTTVRGAAGDLALSGKAFVLHNNPSACDALPTSVCNNMTGECSTLSVGQVAVLCFQNRELDFMPAFGKILESMHHIHLFVSQSCSFIAVFAKILLYPLSDKELWLGVDRLLNAILYACVSAPSATITRCKLAGGIETRPAMCTPDFGPAFLKFAEFGLHVGNALTNWMDAAYLFLFYQTNIDNVCDTTTRLNDVLWSDPVVQRLFGQNQTVMTRLSQSAFAVSDGSSVVFIKGTSGQIRKTYAPNLWSTPIDPRYGIARVFLPGGVNVQDNGLGLMGCRCLDQGATIRVQCTVIAQDGTAWEMPVQWSLAAEVQLLTCDRLRIVVQSIRWPHQRVIGNTQNINGEVPTADCIGCLAADTVVYAIPVCGAADGFKAMACFPEKKGFTRGICFPYCMALRLQHEGFGALTMRGAEEWQNGVLMAMRNCVPTTPTGTVEGNVQTTCTLGSGATSTSNTNDNAECTYAYSCTTMLLNKSAAYAGGQWPAAPKASWDGSHLLLMGQPLVIGGDVFMRMFEEQANNLGKRYVDFPMIVGNQVGEFSVEASMPVGIPVSNYSDVVKNSQSAEVRGEVYEPVAYVSNTVPYNPGTLTPTALWYASNPSYDWIKSMSIYCASEGHKVTTQLMLLSSYAPTRIWRVLYHDYENCYVASESGSHVCVPDIALATGLEKAIAIMTSDALAGSTTLYDMCSSKMEFNLWVESLEYYDAENIAVAVRRGTLADLGSILQGKTGGKTVFYFFNASNISQTPQEGQPSAALQKLTCPAFKVMPDVGAVLGHAVATVAHLFRMPVNLVLNPFAMVELLFSRAEHRCPENSMQHSVLENCGMQLLSLDTFFAELYETNDAMWNVGFWLLSTLVPQDKAESSPEAAMFRSFVQGALVVGDATKVVGMFDVVHSVEMFDSGVQESVLGSGARRRRLLGIKMTALSKLLSGFKSGISSLLSLGQAVAGIATMSLSAANFGALLASQDPTTQFAGAAVAAPSIAWAQFTYQASVPIVLDSLGLLKKTGTFSMTPVWAHLQDAEGKFKSIVQTRSRRACMGLRIMLGYGGSFGKALYYNCLAAEEMVGGMMTVVLSVLVDISIYRCLCVNPVGSDYMAYVQAQCITMIPPTRKDWWQRAMASVTSQSSETMVGLCKNYSSTIETQIYGAFDPWKTQAFYSADSVASLLDELFAPTNAAGSCQNTLTNPTAMVLTPTPLAHYQVCARTTACQSRCADANSVFEAERQRLLRQGSAVHVGARDVDVGIESPLVNRYASSANRDLSKTIIGMRTLPANNSVYGCKTRCHGSCIAVATTAGDTNKKVRVEFYCLPPPDMILASVYNTNLDAFEMDLSEIQGEIRGLDFALQAVDLYIVLYVLKAETTVSITGSTSLLQSQEVYVFNGQTKNLQRILRSDDLLNKVLGQKSMLTTLVGELEKPTVTSCSILSITEIASQQNGVLVFFIELSANIQGWYGTLQNENSYPVHAIARWDTAQKRDTLLIFYAPCGACAEPDCGGTCHPKLQSTLNLARLGTFMHISDKRYLYLQVEPDERSERWLQAIEIDSVQGMSTKIWARARLSGAADNLQIMGKWTRASFFGSFPVLRKVRDASTHLLPNNNNLLLPYFFQADVEFSSQWLQEIRLAANKLKAYGSQRVTQTAVVQTTCTVLSCSGCTTSRLRLLCHQAQNCALSKCLGTIVQTQNALCGAGSLIQQTFVQAITTWHAMFMTGAELAMLVAKGLGGQSVRVIVLKFPTEQFYNLLCAYKDMLASVVGLCMSLGQVLSNMLVGKGLDLTGGQDVGALVGEQSIKTMSIGQFFFNCITGMTLLPLLAVHRWVMCMANSSLVATSEIGVSVQFGDIYMDPTWMQCAHVTSAFDILNNDNFSTEVQSVVVMFVEFVITLVTGIGESALFLLELGWDSSVDFLIGVVFGLQDILYSFNLRACKVPNYAMRYVLWCSCQDDEYRIPASQRGHGIAQGALWCVGSLSMPLLDGNIGIVYNPYTLTELSEGVKGVTAYINCLSETSDAGQCQPPTGTLLPSLAAQAVEPIAVWARCKTNYMLNTWDIGAGALFMETSNTNGLVQTGLAWGQALGDEFLQCMRDTNRLLVDYSTCMRLFFSISSNSTPAAYFLYEKAPVNSGEPPDACLVFSGLNRSAPANSTLQTVMSDCLMQEGVGEVTACDLNPLIWSGNHPHKMAAANLHGTLPPAQQSNGEHIEYRSVVRRFQAAAAAFGALYDQQSASIDTILFSADGDFVHDFFDCMYLGPYTRVDLLACDADLPNCPFYARDNESGASRDFTPCFGDEMHGDYQLPFTCGSQARRSLIKYFFRNYSRYSPSAEGLNFNISQKIKQATEKLIQNYSDPQSWGCWDPTTKKCLLSACTFANGYAPCLDSQYEIGSEEVGDFIVNMVLGSLPAYYTLSMHDSLPWTAYYKDTHTTNWPAQWGADAGSAATAQRLGWYAPHIPIVTYGPEEVYSMPTPQNTTEERVRASPMWGVCTALLSQTAMSLPLIFSTEQQQWFPAGFWQSFGKHSDMNRLDDVEWVVGNITQNVVAMENCPFVWHQAKRHAPSQSAVCARIKQRWTSGKNSKLNVRPVTIVGATTTITAQVPEGLTFPLFGFLQGHVGYGNQTCVCADSDPVVKGRCVMSTESCASFLKVASLSQQQGPECALLTTACRLGRGGYDRGSVPVVWECLRQVGAGVRCPELGPSDWWGLFPVDCTDNECAIAQQWLTEGSNSIGYEGARFLNEGRAGMRLPNYRHVNATYHDAIHYGQSQKNTMTLGQPQCFSAPDLFPTSEEEDLKGGDDVVRKLFPAAQALFDSPSTATCTRYVIEVVRAEAMGLVSDTAGASARIQAARWKKRCALKIRQLSLCKMNGIFYDVPPPPTQEASCGGITIEKLSDVYLTPGCVVVDRSARRMFDAHMCIAQQTNAKQLVINTKDLLTDACALHPQPLELAEGMFPLSMLYTTGGQPLAPTALLAELSDLQTLEQALFVGRTERSRRDHVSHVLDWWPDQQLLDMPIGYHPTAATDPSELAPALFDSHYVYDPKTQKAFYVHSAVRNGSLLHTTAGAAGLCRTHSAGMPMFNANTNRICTRMSKKASADTPTMPILTPITATLDDFDASEFCASTHTEVPWTADPDDFQSQSAGGILGWQHYMTMDTEQVTTYDLTQTEFPPNWFELAALPPMEEWGTSCANVTWGAGIACTGSNHCPHANMACLALNDTSGICYSAADSSRQPCFRTDHCADGMVCLADGGCGPLYLHIWNDAENGFDMEATVLADKCGFFEKVHPYTQSMRGASPWEMVPDTLHAHGMCSHHNWFSYRHAIQKGICPLQNNNLRCSGNTTEWPWLKERFDGHTATERQTMAAGNMLTTHAHPCDVRFMHLKAPLTGRRMEVCSGFEGQEADPLSMMSTYLHYNLSSQGDWDGVSMQAQDTASTGQWLRTYDEQTGETHVGVVRVDESTDIPYGFLGADHSAEGVVGEMATASRVDFFRCTDRLKCNNPPYTYGGVEVKYRLVADPPRNMTELSLRVCGSIGYVNDNDPQQCTLDIALFPLLVMLIEETNTGSCSQIWTNFLSTAFNGWIVTSTTTATTANLATNPSTLFCSTATSPPRCIYAARSKSELSQQNLADSVAFLTNQLNTILQNAAQRIVSLSQTQTATSAYETINRCMATTVSTLIRIQATRQTAYGTATASGIYFAYSLTLYEIPLSWLHHAMLVALLSTLDSSIAVPALHRIGLQNTISLDLWGANKEFACADSRAKPFLWQVLCNNLHPRYTFESAAQWRQDIAAKVESQAIAAVSTSTQNEQSKIYCYDTISWACELSGNYQDCRQQLELAYDESQCSDQVLSNLSNNPWLQVCGNSHLFRYENPKEYTLQTLIDGLSKTAQAQITGYLQRGKTALLDNLKEIAQPQDYIATDSVNPAAVPLIRISMVNAEQFVRQATGSFDMAQWLKNDVCSNAFADDEVCKDQAFATLLEGECLFPNAQERNDIDRHIIDSTDSAFYNTKTKQTEPKIILSYATNGQNGVPVPDTEIFFCDHSKQEQCIVQHRDNAINLRTSLQDVVLCDINRVQAPPGVEVQLFAITGEKSPAWEALLGAPNLQEMGAPPKWCSTLGTNWSRQISPVRNCVWQQLDPSDDPITGGATTWLRAPSAFEPIDQSFVDLDGQWDQGDTQAQWRSMGCHESDVFTGFCAVSIRFENKPGQTRAICEDSQVDPNCASIMNDNRMSTFRVFTDRSPNKKGYYQCKPCTKYRNLIRKDNGRFQCYASQDGGKTIHPQISIDSIARTLDFVSDPTQLAEKLGLDRAVFDITTQTDHTLISVRTSTEGNPTASELIMGAGSWTDFDTTATADSNLVIWNQAVNNPNIKFTMICGEQPYSASDRKECNSRIDKRRQGVAAFVEQQYRQTNGVWMPRAKAGKGLAWRANVAHSDVGMFSVMYAKANRKEEDKILAWILGSSICASDQTALQDRICVESVQAGSSMFEAMHPWVGGDFNPFEELDECPSTTGGSLNTDVSLCPCVCDVPRVCDEYQGDSTKLDLEFPYRQACGGQAFPRWRTMQKDDRANLCRVIGTLVDQKKATTCLHPQGLLGNTKGNGDQKITTEELHSSGLPTYAYEYLIQTLLSSENGLWGSQTLRHEATDSSQNYAFLRMPRADLHPAHIAFGRDLESTGQPFVVKAMALLAYDNQLAQFAGPPNTQWVRTLQSEREDEGKWIKALYPQLLQQQATANYGWSCPLRAVAFWGGTSETFAPITPDPLLASRMFVGGGGTHPFIKAQRLRFALAKYETSNGACFYEKGQSRAVISLKDGDNPCGLQAMVRNLHSNTAVLSRVQNHFYARCNDVLDAPHIHDTQLRSNETMLTQASKAECGALHRLTPFLMRTRGDAGEVHAWPDLTTSSEGGDCHMGRAFTYAFDGRDKLVGRQCALSFKNKTYGISLCPQAGRIDALNGEDFTTLPLQRVQPLSLRDVLVMRGQRLYRSKLPDTPPLQFIGPLGIPLPENAAEESSFGLLYSVSLPMSIAGDLLQTCKKTKGCTAHLPPNDASANNFWKKYVTRGGLVDSQEASSQRGTDGLDPSVLDATARRNAFTDATIRNTALWNQTQWTWTFQAQSTASSSSRGTVDATHWLRDRYGACNASYHKYGRLPKGQSLVEAITLCEPAPTGGLQTFCQAMSRFRTDMANVNCQIMSNGKDCLYQPGMFYLPYQWSGTNQQFIADTVLQYYSDVLKQSRFATSITTSTSICPARNAVMGKLYDLSLQQRDSCPGYQIDYLKDVLKTFKLAGHDLLYMCFCAVMAGANLVGTVFAIDPAALATMAKMAFYYVVEMVKTAANVVMPILNTIIDVMFGTSSAGRVIKNIFEVLCETFNFVVEKIIIPIWCGMVRPWWGTILRGIQSLISVFDKSSAKKMDEFISTVFGSNSFNVQECLGSIKAHIQCSADKEAVNDSLFPNQPMATRCWVDTSHSYYTAGASVLAGSSTNSFLACTVSDTCAVDPLRFDNYENANDLVPCIMCPAVALDDQAQAFGCNTYLKRCTCGVRIQQPAACVRNSDCSQQPTSICSVPVNLDFARDSATTMLCTECGGLGAEPICLLDGAATTGVCACSVVRESLHMCTSAAQTNGVFLLNAEGKCLCMTASDQVDALSLSFSELSVAPCMMGLSNRCILVSLPLTSGGSQQLLFAVLTGIIGGLFQPQQLLLSAITAGGRRLLLHEQVEPHRRWCEMEWNGDRESIRWCTHWKMVGNHTLQQYHLSHPSIGRGDDAFLLSPGRALQFLLKNPMLVAQRPDLVKTILKQHAGVVPHLLLALWQAVDDVSLLTIHTRSNNTSSSNKRKMLLWEQETTITDSYYTDATDITTKLPSCVAIEIPLNKIFSAFWDTVAYYEQNARAIVSNDCIANTTMDNNTEEAPVCMPRQGYQLPPTQTGSTTTSWNLVAELFMFIPTGGVGGSRVLNAMLSPMPYDEALANNYVTGRRIIKEISSCNYTTLTFGVPATTSLLGATLTVTFFFLLFTVFFSPHAFVTWALWVFVFPSILYWLLYNLSPLCWPMIPPRLPHDLVVAIEALVPTSLEIPTFLIQPNCTARGRRIEDDVYDPDMCFKSCSQDPFYLVSWQDELAWWVCEVDTALCRSLADKVTSKWNALQDMTASLNYYAEVVDFAPKDGDFMRAHRVCAIFGLYHIIFATMIAVFAVLVAPAAVMSILQIFAAAFELIIEASGAENV